MQSKSEQQSVIRQLHLEGLETSGDTFNFRCPLCGDSKKDSSKKRGYFYWETNTYKFKCHNCGIQTTLVWYLKEHEPELYKREMYNQIKNKKEKSYKYKEEKEVKTVDKVSNNKVKEMLNDMYSNDIFSDFDDVSDYHAIKYIHDRKIPKNKIKHFFYCENFYELMYKPLKVLIREVEQDVLDEETFNRDPRVFWFIKDRSNNIIGLQGRSLTKNSKIRYLTIKISNTPMIGNIENIDLNQKIYVTEGFIDSIFLNNTVSLNGSSFHSVLNQFETLGAKNIVFVYDNEPHNQEIRAKINMVITESMKSKDIEIGVCLLPKHIRKHGKDINDYIKSGMDKSQLLNIIDDNTYHGLKAKIKFSRW